MDNKIDMSAYMLSDADALSHARLSVRDESIEKAVKMIAERNERTAEQAAIVAQQEEIARLRAELESARVDAERYRFIRRKVCIIERGGFMGRADDRYSVFELINMPEPTHIAPDPAIELDAAIDAARGGK